jgi:hypothetical protein
LPSADQSTDDNKTFPLSPVSFRSIFPFWFFRRIRGWISLGKRVR